MSWNGEVWLDHQAARPVGRSIEPFSGRRSLHACRPDDGFGRQPLSPVGNAAGSAFGNGTPEFYLDTQRFQRALGIGREILDKAGKHAGSGLDQHNPRPARVDVAKVSPQRVPREFDNGAGKLDARRASADDDEGEQHCLPLRIALAFGLLESQQDAAPDGRGVLKRLQRRREGLPVVMAEIGVTRARGEHQRIVGKGGAVLQQDAPRSGIDANGRGQQRCDVVAVAE